MIIEVPLTKNAFDYCIRGIYHDRNYTAGGDSLRIEISCFHFLTDPHVAIEEGCDPTPDPWEPYYQSFSESVTDELRHGECDVFTVKFVLDFQRVYDYLLVPPEFIQETYQFLVELLQGSVSGEDVDFESETVNSVQPMQICPGVVWKVCSTTARLRPKESTGLVIPLQRRCPILSCEDEDGSSGTLPCEVGVSPQFLVESVSLFCSSLESELDLNPLLVNHKIVVLEDYQIYFFFSSEHYRVYLESESFWAG